MLVTRLFIAVILMSLTTVLTAAPSKTPRNLMSRPLTVFDWGMIEIRRKLDTFKSLTLFDIPYLGGSAEYLWNDNLIVLLGKFQGEGTDRECANNLKLMKGGFADFEWDTQKQADAAALVLSQVFNHPAGYASNGKPIEIGRNLVTILRVEATVYVETDGVLKVGARCRSDYGDGKIEVIK
ncbi:MAG: hypothetical protein AB8C46_23680 [Burkholderiaceae bacterium]